MMSTVIVVVTEPVVNHDIADTTETVHKQVRTNDEAAVVTTD